MPTLSVEQLTVDEAEAAMASEFARFRTEAEGWSPLHEPAYLRLWERSFGPRDGGRIVVARDAAGALAGYAPLMRVRGHVGPVPTATLRFIGNNIGYPGDILYGGVLATRQGQPALSAILRHVAETWSVGKWDLGYLPPTSPTRVTVSQVLGDGLVAPGALPSVPFVSVELPEGWDAYFASLTPNTRSSYRRGLRGLESGGSAKVVVDTSPGGVRRRVDELIQNHKRWLSGTQKEHWFGNGAVRDFLVASSELLAERGQFLASALEVDGAPIAWIAGPAYGSRCFLHISSYDRSYSDDSPGLVLGLQLVRELIARGFRTLDLGPGANLYKARLGGTSQPYVRTLGYQGWARRAAWAQGWIHGARPRTHDPASVGASTEGADGPRTTSGDREPRHGGAENGQAPTSGGPQVAVLSRR